MTPRRYHRWIATLFGILILWIAATGVVTQGARIYAGGEHRPAAPAAAPTALPATPPPPQSPTRKLIKFVTDLHSGEQFGLVGQIVSLLSGCALLFLAGSGLWMYITMARARAAKSRAPSGGKWFWQ